MSRLAPLLAARGWLCLALVGVLPARADGALAIGQPRPLVEGFGRVEKPALSPDGTRLAFLSNRSGADNLYVVNLDGGEPVALTRETRPEVQFGGARWSPRGDYLVYTSDKGPRRTFDLWLASADGAQDEPLTTDEHLDWMPTWSPDGRRIAFVSDRDGGDALWTIAVDGSDLRKLTELAYEPAWSPDGTQIAVYLVSGQADGLALLPLAGGPPRMILEGGRMPCWSPDGRYLVAVRADETGDRLWLCDLQQGVNHPLGPALAGLAWPTWGAAGPSLAYEAAPAGRKQAFLAALVESRPQSVILQPTSGSAVRGAVPIVARAAAEAGTVASWRLESGAGAAPRDWRLIAEGTGAVDGTLATWNTAGLEGLQTLRLTAVSTGGETSTAAVTVTVFGQYGTVWEAHDLPSTMTVNGVYTAELQVRNSGTMTWRKEGLFAVAGSYQWLDQAGQVVVAEGLSSPLSQDVGAEGTATIRANILAPPVGGEYTLRYDLRQGGQVWFAEQGAQPLEAPVTVTVPYAFDIHIPAAPGVMVPGQIYTVELELTNKGSLTWPGLAASGAAPGPGTVQVTCAWQDLAGGLVEATPLLTPLPDNVAPGQRLTLLARVQAPSTNGRYRLSFDLRDGGGLLSERQGGRPRGVDVQVSSPYAVEFLGHTTPGRMFPGDIVPVNIQARNVGSIRWRADGPQPIKLSYRWLDRLGQPAAAPAMETNLPYDVAPGMSSAVAARVQTPGAPGEYQLEWDLVQLNGKRFGELGNVPLRVPVMIGAPTHSVRWEQLHHPVDMVVGSLYTVELRLTNTGAMTWKPGGADGVRLGYHWVRANGDELTRAPLFTDLPAAIDSGASVRLSARVQAPERPGAYMLKWDLYQGGYDYFSTRGAATLDVPVNVEIIYGCEWVSHDTPAKLVAGQRYKVNLRLRNRGTVPWEHGGAVPVVLGYRWFNAAGDAVTAGEPLRASLPRTVQPGDSVDLSAYLLAPTLPGRYDLEWDLLFASTFWFSEKSVPPLRVTVLVE